MTRNILAAVKQIKAEVAKFLSPELIRGVCATVGHVWRERVLDPVTTLHLFALQILHGNTACSHVPPLGGVDCTGEVYCQARQRLPLQVLQYLLRASVNFWAPARCSMKVAGTDRTKHGLKEKTALDGN